MIARGRVWKVGDNMTAGGDITPTEYEHLGANFKFAELATHVFEHVLPGFASAVQKGDFIVAGKNFGAGHGHFLVPAIKALSATGVSACIAESYSGVFQRRAINAGFPAIESRDIHAIVETGDELEVNLLTGDGKNLTRGDSFRVSPLPEMILDILKSGGLESYAVKKLRTAA